MSPAMDFIFEFLFQIVFELGEVLLEAGFHGASRVLGEARTVGRRIIVGFGAGAWWGAYLSDAGGAPSRLFWVSIILGLVATAAALIPHAADHDRRVAVTAPNSGDSRSWQWPRIALPASRDDFGSQPG